MERTEKVLNQILGNASIDLKAEAIPLDRIIPNRYQPRKIFEQSKLEELAASITQNGLIQPIIVRQIDTDDGSPMYELIAGERRFRAAKIAGLTLISVIIRQATDHDLMALALIENIQREDLNALEKASAIAALKSDLGETSLVAKAIGFTDRTVERYLRVHKEINSTPDFAPIFQQADFCVAYEFAALAPTIRKLLKSDKREYDRTLSYIGKTGIKNAIPKLAKKFAAKENANKPSQMQYQQIKMRETASDFILTLRHPKSIALSQHDLEAFNAVFKEYIGKLDCNVRDKQNDAPETDFHNYVGDNREL